MRWGTAFLRLAAFVASHRGMHLPQSTQPSHYESALLANTRSMLAFWDRELRCCFANRACDEWFGVRPVELRGRSIQDLLGPSLFALNEPYIRAALAGSEQRFEHTISCPDGQPRHSFARYAPWVVEGEVVGFIAEVTDATPSKVAQPALQSEAIAREHAWADAGFRDGNVQREAGEPALADFRRLESLGQVAGVVAHDFNNILQLLSVHLRRIKMRRSDADLLAAVDAGDRAVRRGKEMVSNILAVAGSRELAPTPVNVHALIQALEDDLRALVDAHLLRLDLCNDAPLAATDPFQLERAIVNLVINARDASPPGSTIVVATRRVVRSLQAGEAQAPLVAISVTDRGSGMTPEIARRAMEPLFTTKGAGGGTGLGLSMVYSLAQRCGGSVEIASTVGHGTTVTCLLPDVGL